MDGRVTKLLERESLIPICPEQMGGLPTPREPSGIMGGDGRDALNERAKVYNIKGEDVSWNFIQGAYQALKLARLLGIKEAILKQQSPSCGCGETQGLRYEGEHFVSYPIKGNGVTAALLKENGLKLLTEDELEGL